MKAARLPRVGGHGINLAVPCTDNAQRPQSTPPQHTWTLTMAQAYRLDSIYNLRGRIALVTGGGTGIGWMISQGLAANGATVYITGRRKDVLEKAAAEFAKDSQGGGSIVPCVVPAISRRMSLLTPARAGW